jgi:hypothetical protein
LSKDKDQKMKKSEKERRRKNLVARYNGEFACNKPTEKRIDKIKNYVRGVKKLREKLVDNEMELLEVQLEQEEVVREYISDNRDQPGLAVTEASRQSFNVHMQR